MEQISSLDASFLRFALAFIAFMILPGYLIFRLFFSGKTHKAFEILPLSFVFSVAYISTLGMILHFAGSDVTALLRVLYISIGVLIILNLLLRRRIRYRNLAGLQADAAASADVGYLGRPISITVGALLVFSIALMLYRGAVFTYSSDVLDHLGTIREIVEKRQIFPTNSFYAGEDGLGADPRKGLYHVAVAILSILTHVEPYKIWIYLPALILPIMLCGYFAFARELFRNNRIALIALVLFFFCYGGIDTEFKRAVGYPSRVAFLIYLTALFTVFTYIRGRNFKYLIASAFLGYAIGTVHVYYYFQFLLALFAFFVFMILFRRDCKDVILSTMKLGILTLLFSIPILYLRFTLSYSTENPYDSALRHVVFFTDNIYIVNPTQPWDRIGLAGLVAFLGVPFLYKYTRKHYGIAFLFATMIVVPLIIFNPIVVPLLGKFLTIGLVRRIILLAPYIAVLAFFAYTAMTALGSLCGDRKKTVTIRSLAVLILFALMMVPYLFSFYRQHKPSTIEYERNHSALLWVDALDFLEEHIDEAGVIVSDPITSYSIPAFTKHYIVAVPIGHSSPKDALNVQKVRDAMKILNPYIDMKSTVALLNQYRAGYVVLNERFDQPIYQYGWSLNPALYDLTRSKFEERPDLFENIYNKNGMRIYQYHAPAGAADLDGGGIPERSFISAHVPVVRKAVNAIFEDRFLLIGANMDRETVRRGDVVRMKCYWRNLQEEATSQSYNIYVRFDTDYDKNRLYNETWSKPYRRVLQLFRGERYRFRSSHNPLNSMYPPNFWRKNEIVIDEFQVRIPHDVAPGTYDVKIKLSEMPFSPNYHFTDFLSDDDSYSGVTVGTVVIER
jgi:hypothetical protein